MSHIQLNRSDTNTTDDWNTGERQVNTTVVTVAVGVTCDARTPLAMLTAVSGSQLIGEIVEFDSNDTNDNGTNVAVFLSAYDIDTTAEKAAYHVTDSGTFNPDLVNFTQADPQPTEAQLLSMFLNTGIFLQEPA